MKLALKNNHVQLNILEKALASSKIKRTGTPIIIKGIKKRVIANPKP